MTFRDLISFWQVYDELYIEQYIRDRRYSSSVVDQAVQAFGTHDTDIFYSSSSSPRLSSYRRLNSQNEDEPLFQDLVSATNDELDACFTVNGKIL